MSSRVNKNVIGCNPARFQPFEDNNPLFCYQCKFENNSDGCEMFRQKRQYRRVRENP